MLDIKMGNDFISKWYCQYMNDFQKQIKKFAEDRNWSQFHNPKDLLLGIVEEIGEIRNIVKWEQDINILNHATQIRNWVE